MSSLVFASSLTLSHETCNACYQKAIGFNGYRSALKQNEYEMTPSQATINL